MTERHLAIRQPDGVGGGLKPWLRKLLESAENSSDIGRERLEVLRELVYKAHVIVGRTPPEIVGLTLLAQAYEYAVGDVPVEYLEVLFTRAVRAKVDNWLVTGIDMRNQWRALVLGCQPPEGCSFDRDAAGRWVPLMGYLREGTLPYGATNDEQVQAAHRERYMHYLALLRTVETHKEEGGDGGERRR